MTGRIILTVLVVVLTFAFIQIMEQKVAPSHAADLAVQSVNDPSAMEQMRIEQNAQNWLDPVTYACSGALLLGIWLGPIKKQIQKVQNEDVSVHENG